MPNAVLRRPSGSTLAMIASRSAPRSRRPTAAGRRPCDDADGGRAGAEHSKELAVDASTKRNAAVAARPVGWRVTFEE
jgi:hypothetical protein